MSVAWRPTPDVWPEVAEAPEALPLLLRSSYRGMQQRGGEAPRARAGPTEALPQSEKVLREGERFLPVLPAGDREKQVSPEYPFRGVRGGRRISGL